MKLFKVIVPTLILLLTYSSFRVDTKSSLYLSSFDNVLGTSFDLKVMAVNEQQADLAEKVALEEINRLSAILSSYDPNSEFSKWFKTSHQEVKVSEELFEILSLFDAWRYKTNGALDAAAGGALVMWKEAEKQQVYPATPVIDQVTEEIKKQHWRLDAENKTAIHLTTTPLVMNSFVKSYIISKVADKLMELKGISAVVVNIGGDLVVKGDYLEWVRVINPQADAENHQPLSTIRVGNRAIATSGNYRRGYNIQGHWYSHIIDPRTALPVNHILSATIVSKNATDAGALATAFNILSPSEATALAATFDETEFQIVTADGEILESSGWKKMLEEEQPNIPPVADANLPSRNQTWNKDFTLDVNVSLMRFPTMTRRPFVAIWVEDKDKNSVRTLALWYNKPRWLPDLREWYHKNYSTFQNSPQGIYSISSATRPSGFYTLTWDGKNDKGEYVEAGTYTVFIEVAREHGTYQLIKQEITCKGKEQKHEIPGNPEVSSASVEYKKMKNGK